MKGKKHAFLIMAHNNFYNLEILIRMLDDERNNIFLHVDKKVRNFDSGYFSQLVKKAKLFIYQEIRVNWGGYSQVKCELFLLEKARKTEDHLFYHLLSSADLPIKTQDQIHTFFDGHPDEQFIQLDQKRLTDNRKQIERRLKYYHPIQEIRKCSSNKAIETGLTIIAKSMMAVQMICGIDRMKKKKLNLAFGSQWFSINEEFVDFLLRQTDKIDQIFAHSQTPDELFIQMLAINSRFKNTIYQDENGYQKSNKREIGWNYEKDAEHPQVYTIHDFEKLTTSGAMFARKFSDTTDREIIDQIYNQYGGDENE